ncbi:MAG: family 78 glycoside hydrolase catalytic domain [Candidatus Omnitrophica bacterium]|nr:family 78 glycoside hydrolase catalytic domain [Candidatus Omnitrophota bacterium]
MRYLLASITFTLIGVTMSQPAVALEIEKTYCEMLTNPLGIEADQPRLTWILNDPEMSRGAAQSAYEVVVASDPSLLEPGKADVWDSGRVRSGENHFIEYGGRPLQSGERVYWKVRVWDRKDEVSDWSEPSYWQMGLLEPLHWKAEWIEHPGKVEAPFPANYARKEFSIDGKVRRATLYSTALGLYEVFLNGEKVGDHVLAPEWTDYDARVQYQSYDVTDMLNESANTIGAILGNGWYAGKIGLTLVVPDGPTRGIYGDQPKFMAQLEVETEDGKKQIVTTDNTWKITKQGPIQANDLLDGETIDSRNEMPGWNKNGFDDSNWQAVDVWDAIGPDRVAQRNQPIRKTQEIAPVSITEPSPGVYIYDLGQIFTGWCRVKVKGSKGTEVLLRHGEVLNEDGSLYTANLRVPKDGRDYGAKQEDRFILSGDGEEVFEPRFTYHGFRYVEVTGLNQKPELEDLVGVFVHSDCPEVSSFSCSDEFVNQLMQNIFWTQKDNMHSIPTDCPQRDERCGWMGDALVFAQMACFNMNMDRFFTKWLVDIRDAQARDGRFPDFAPQPYDSDIRFSGVPSWGDAGVFVPWDVYVNYADKRILEENFEAIERWLTYIGTQSPEYLWTGNRGNDYGDWLNGDLVKMEGWPENKATIPKEVLATAFYARSSQLASRMATVLGKQDRAKHYSDLHEKIRDAYFKAYVNDEKQVKGNTQSGYALSLYYNLVPDEDRAALAKHMVEAVEEYNHHISTGFQTTKMLMTELTDSGNVETAYQLLLNRELPSWGYMIDHGATTMWERWDGYVEGRGFQDPGMNSFCHYSFGAVGEWIYKLIVGIAPDPNQPGFKHIRMEPHPGGGLTWAKVSLDTVRGTVVSDWRIEGKAFIWKVRVPVGSAATLSIPATENQTVTESGKKIDASETIGKSKDRVICRVLSGEYEFRVE